MPGRVLFVVCSYDLQGSGDLWVDTSIEEGRETSQNKRMNSCGTDREEKDCGSKKTKDKGVFKDE